MNCKAYRCLEDLWRNIRLFFMSWGKSSLFHTLILAMVRIDIFLSLLPISCWQCLVQTLEDPNSSWSLFISGWVSLILQKAGRSHQPVKPRGTMMLMFPSASPNQWKTGWYMNNSPGLLWCYCNATVSYFYVPRKFCLELNPIYIWYFIFGFELLASTLFFNDCSLIILWIWLTSKLPVSIYLFIYF